MELTEYVKVEDSIFKVNSKALCPDEQLMYDRITTFTVRTIYAVTELGGGRPSVFREFLKIIVLNFQNPESVTDLYMY